MSEDIASRGNWELTQYAGPDIPGRARTRYQLGYANDRQSRFLNDISQDDLHDLAAMLTATYRPVGEL